MKKFLTLHAEGDTGHDGGNGSDDYGGSSFP